MYRHDKDITIAYKGIKTLKASFQESCKERQNEEQITSDKY